jgi:chloramphenicol 3-O-phosphotransferase
MQITRIHAEHYLGLRHVDLTLRHRVTLIAGANGAGKSSLAEALRLALCAESVRVGLKKEYPALVHKGAKGASITVERDGCEPVVVSITAAGAVKHDDKVWQDSDPAMPFVLDAGRFARCDRDARSNLLFDVMDVATDTKAIERRLLARDCAPVLVTQFAPILRAGFEHAHKEATKRVSEARGAWKAVTGETYGEVKAKTWKADPGDWKTDEAAQLQALDATIEKLRADHAEAQRRLGAARSEHDRFAEYGKKLAAMRNQAAEFAVHQAAVNRAEAVLSAAKGALEAARLAAGTAPPPKPKTCACPACGVELVPQADGSLVEYAAPAPVPHDPKALGKIPGLKATVSDAERTLAAHVALRNAAERAAQDVRAMEDNIPAEPKQHPDIVASNVGMIATELETKVALQRKLRAAYERFDAADRKTKDARRHHADVLAWSKIAEALAPDGIPGELLAEALGPINERLAQSAADAGWKPVRIGEDMSITADGREYRLLSESERWRADVMICEAIAHLSELRIMVLDRFDVLDMRGRSEALGWLDVLADTGEIDSAIVLGTLKALPPSLPETIGAHWIERGVIEAQDEAQAA